MDGGHVLRALLARSRPFVQATRTAVAVAKVIAVLLGLFAVLMLNVLLLLLAGFVYLAAVSEATTVVTRDLLGDIGVRDLVHPELTVIRAGTLVVELINRMLSERRTEYVVVDRGGTVLGTVTLADIQDPATLDPGTTVEEVMTEDPPTISADARFLEVVRDLVEHEDVRPDLLDHPGSRHGLFVAG